MWSNDGKQIAFDTWKGIFGESLTDVHIIVTDSEGKDLKDLGQGAMPSFSPDGKKIAYSKYEPRGVYVMNADGTGEQLIDSEGWCAKWSPKKDELLYTVNDSAGANICVKDLKTGDQRILLKTQYQSIYWGLSWSPDGQWICFNGNGTDVAVVNADGEEKGFKVLISGEDSQVKKVQYYFGWSPDSKQILANMQMDDSKYSLMYLLDREGKTPPKPLAGQDTHRSSGGVAWSPDGKKILGGTRFAPLAPAEKKQAEKSE
jgi:TolB protein